MQLYVNFQTGYQHVSGSRTLTLTRYWQYFRRCLVLKQKYELN